MTRHALVICTKDRPDELALALDSVAAQETLPTRVMVVDSSSGDGSAQLVARLAEGFPTYLVYVHSEPGLTRQRNVALTLTRDDAEIVHFIDDDAILAPDYLVRLLHTFATHPQASGVGGRITNLPEHQAHWWRILAGIDSTREGVVLPSGVNILSFTGNSEREVDWLSGCSMSFRLASIADLEFDETRTGNGLGEDVDFCLRAQVRGPLIWNPRALVEHRQSPVNRDSSLRLQRAVVVSRWKMAQQDLGRVQRQRVITGALSDASILLGKGLWHRSRTSVRSSAAVVQGILDIARTRGQR